MKNEKIHLEGNRFGRLVVISEMPTIKGHSYWLCKCDCGQSKIICYSNLVDGRTKSCGCLNKELARERRIIKHGMHGTREYHTWEGMVQRCTNPNAENWENYGGRGITICKRWMKFENFYADMGLRPIGKTLDRINNNGNYTPDNCKWSTPKEQRNNQRSRNRIINLNLTQ